MEHKGVVGGLGVGLMLLAVGTLISRPIVSREYPAAHFPTWTLGVAVVALLVGAYLFGAVIWDWPFPGRKRTQTRSEPLGQFIVSGDAVKHLAKHPGSQFGGSVWTPGITDPTVVRLEVLPPDRPTDPTPSPSPPPGTGIVMQGSDHNFFDGVRYVGPGNAIHATDSHDNTFRNVESTHIPPREKSPPEDESDTED
jgi:hypothetical protein